MRHEAVTSVFNQIQNVFEAGSSALVGIWDHIHTMMVGVLGQAPQLGAVLRRTPLL